MLARGADDGLKAAAAKDLAGATTPEQQVDSGDDWWGLAQARPARPDEEKEAMLLRAGVRYQQALASLGGGLAKIKAERRLKEIADLVPASALTAPAVGVSPAATSKPDAAQAEGVLPLVCEEVATGWTAPKILVSGGIAILPPPRDGRRAAQGVLVPAPQDWESRGTAWTCRYSRTAIGYGGIQFIHPYQKGHVLVTVGEEGVGATSLGRWPGYRPGRESVVLARGAKSGGTLQFEPDVVYQFTSSVSRDGNLSFHVDGKLIGTTMVWAAAPLAFEPDFKGQDLPLVLPTGMGGIIAAPNDGGRNRAQEVRFGVLPESKGPSRRKPSRH